jgi:Protein of unknown function (DUF4019)
MDCSFLEPQVRLFKILSKYFCLGFGALVLLSGFASSQQTQEPHREVNVTRDSTPGWVPTEDQQARAVQALAKYFSFVEHGDYRKAYDFLTPVFKQSLSFEKFSELSSHYWSKSGEILGRSILKVTWTKDSPNAPIPGVYAAIDIAIKSTNIDRQCGYVIFYQRDEKDSFTLMREETNFIDNKTAAGIAKSKSQAAVQEEWAKIAANCPGGVYDR